MIFIGGVQSDTCNVAACVAILGLLLIGNATKEY